MARFIAPSYPSCLAPILRPRRQGLALLQHGGSAPWQPREVHHGPCVPALVRHRLRHRDLRHALLIQPEGREGDLAGHDSRHLDCGGSRNRLHRPHASFAALGHPVPAADCGRGSLDTSGRRSSASVDKTLRVMVKETGAACLPWPTLSLILTCRQGAHRAE